MDPHVRSVNSPFKVAPPCVEGSDNGICHPDFDISLKVSKTKLLPGFTKYRRPRENIVMFGALGESWGLMQCHITQS